MILHIHLYNSSSPLCPTWNLGVTTILTLTRSKEMLLVGRGCFQHCNRMGESVLEILCSVSISSLLVVWVGRYPAVLWDSECVDRNC